MNESTLTVAGIIFLLLIIASFFLKDGNGGGGGNVIFVGLILVAIISFLINSINTLQDGTDVNYGFQENVELHGDNGKYSIDSQGNEILKLHSLSFQEQKKLWNNSVLKEDMVALFPNFSEIKYFIDEHIEDDGKFKQKLLKHVEKVELEYIGGNIKEQSAKATLSQF